MPRTPVVAIVGRPNVGKSTLFNRLLGRRQAIVHNLPGVTRDRVTSDVELDGVRCVLIDTGGLVPPDGDELGLTVQVELAIDESDVLLFVVDGKQGLTTADEHIWETLRPRGKPTLLVVNKGDTRAAQESAAEFSRLGMGEWYLVSAEHGQGVEALAESAARLLPEAEAEPALDALPLALVGRPNVGKSSILNRLLGEERALVSPTPGTTRDPIDSVLVRDDERYLLIDTAGIRRRAKASGAPEELAIMLARRQIERAEIAILVIDAFDGVTSGDLAVADTIWELGRSAVVAVNKWDLVTETVRDELEKSWRRLDEMLGRPRRINISAETGRGLDKILPAVEEVRASHFLELGTGEVNRLFERAVERHHAPAIKHRPWKFYYATQVRTGPPTFMVFANAPLRKGGSYRRYLENVVRRELDLRGVPARLVVRKR